MGVPVNPRTPWTYFCLLDLLADKRGFTGQQWGSGTQLGGKRGLLSRPLDLTKWLPTWFQATSHEARPSAHCL